VRILIPIPESKKIKADLRSRLMNSREFVDYTSLEIHEDITGTIGGTPLVRLNNVTRGLECTVYAKLEMFNPGGSVKDRIAFPILEAFERDGSLKPGGTVIEATSGNTGVGLAIACALKGYQSVFVMPDKMSDDKVRLLRAYGARVVITPTAVAPEDPRSYYSVTNRIVAETPNAILANQYHNPNNPEAHYRTTAPEIWEQTRGNVTDIVVGMGTGGTITGIARYMQEQGHAVRMIGVDPIGSLLYDAWKQGGSIEGLEAFTFKVEGIGEDFVPSTLDLQLVDDVVQVDDAEAFRWTRRLVRDEGIFGGGSSGAVVAGALKAASNFGPERFVVVIFPDDGSRYLTKVFNDDWMREHGFLGVDTSGLTALQVARSRGFPTLITARAEDSKAAVIARMRQHAVSQLPVVDDSGSVLGIISEVELLEHMLAKGHHSVDETISELINRDVCVRPAESPFEDAVADLLARKVCLLIDDLNQPIGILTIIDALEHMASVEVQ
jgi:cystathionine beta-synthase